jgi:hypothetical protein
MKRVCVLVALVALSGCAGPIYQAPSDVTPQTEASLTGIVNPMANLFSTGTHICVEAIDGATPSQICNKPILISPGTHSIEISADFHPFPAEFGFTTVTATFVAGQAYFIRATGGPVSFKNSNGMLSLPASGLTVWIESAAGAPIIDKTMIALQSPQSVPILIFNK